MRNRNLGTNTIVAVAALCSLLALPSATPAADQATVSLEALAEQSATTAAQHESLAAYYRGKAGAARAEAKNHQSMALSFPSKGSSGMQAHCQNLADAAQKAATSYDAMAAIHDEEATKAGK
jgi:hypothetical protein